MDGGVYAQSLLDLQGGLMHATHHHHKRQQHLQQPSRKPPQAPMVHSPVHDPFHRGHGPEQQQQQQQQKGVSFIDFTRADNLKISISDDDEMSYNEDGIDGHNEADRRKKISQWHRIKWTGAMVRLLITAVSYTGEDALSECSAGSRKNQAILQKMGKWKTISKVLAERGCYVSPQQCEDKFNDLNKKYKRLNEILGRGTSCEVVENPALLDVMDHVSDRGKEDVRKILSSRHLFYEEMCSYHNSNRLHLPADPALQRSLQLALRNAEDEAKMASFDDLDDENHDIYSDEDNSEDNLAEQRDTGFPCSIKRMRPMLNNKEAGFGNEMCSNDANRGPHPQGVSVDLNQVFPEGPKTPYVQKQWLSSRSLQLEEQKLYIHTEMLALEKRRFKWQRFSKKKDRELEKMKMDNERLKLENERMALELKRKELDFGHR